ncbi:MAG: heme d1 biosynthesis radical SAM protein NirJ, partial [Rhodospirillales bacterium]|nr:heme d1 biosynthesis radical SAM protein NirJ [Rhodospirillales bacterium]
IWNLTRRCNLTCKHCYSHSANKHYSGELSTGEARTVMEDLRAYGVPVLILSGGEPLLWPDIHALSRYAKSLGFFVALSSNGTLITEETADAIAETGYDYVGVSLDGIGSTHDRFRCLDGAFAASIAGIHRCKARGIKAGLRFTMTQDNAHELPQLLDLLEAEDLEKFYFSHLNYAGRGNRNRGTDTVHATTRWAMDLLFERCLDGLRSGRMKEFVTGNNDADAAYFLLWLRRRFPEREADLRVGLTAWGGNATGIGVANIDTLGNVHPDTFWSHHTMGNVRERPFSAIWSDQSDPVISGLRRRPRPVGGRCAECRFLPVCNGNTRIRSWQLTGDLWGEDPGCYLTTEEVHHV